MPIIKSAKKALRQTAKRTVLNLRRRRAMKSVVKEVCDLKSPGSDKAADLLSQAFKAIDKAAKRGVIKKGTADRKKSRLAKMCNRQGK